LIRTLSAAQAQTAIDWAAAEGWNPGLSDLSCFLAQDRGLFLAVEQDGALQSLIAATRYLSAFGFIGFYIARPESRGQGHGMAVWQAAMRRLEGRLIGLDGVVAQQDNYRKSGFQLAWNNIRFGGGAQGLPAPSGRFVPASAVDFGTLSALACAGCPSPERAPADSGASVDGGAGPRAKEGGSGGAGRRERPGGAAAAEGTRRAHRAVGKWRRVVQPVLPCGAGGRALPDGGAHHPGRRWCAHARGRAALGRS
jgi:hypothetical protein